MPTIFAGISFIRKLSQGAVSLPPAHLQLQLCCGAQLPTCVALSEGGGACTDPKCCALRVAPATLLRPLASSTARGCVQREVCTYVATGKRYTQQRWFTCSCNGHAEGTGICEVCAKYCHVGPGHETRLQSGSAGSGGASGIEDGAGGEGMFCDCGAGADFDLTSERAFERRCRCLDAAFQQRGKWMTHTRALAMSMPPPRK